MAQNTTDEYRKFRYYEGVCSSDDFIKEIAKVVSLGVKTEPNKTADGQIQDPARPIKVKNWDIVYPMVSTSFEEYNKLSSRDLYLSEEDDVGLHSLNEERRIAKLENQISQIKNMVVLRTTTTPREISDDDKDDLSVSGDVDQASTTMYVQLFKPTYLANPEEYPLDAELQGLVPQLITKEMYKEARKSTASVIYDLAQLVTSPLKDDGTLDPDGDYSNVRYKTTYDASGNPLNTGHEGLVTKKESLEFVDCVSHPYKRVDLFEVNGKNGESVLAGLNKYGYNIGSANTNPENSELEPTENNRTKSIIIDNGTLSQIKQTNTTLYNFIYGICGLRSAFKDTDYASISSMIVKVSLVGEPGNTDFDYYVTISYQKKVEIYTISPGVLNVLEEYQHEALDYIKPELYSEGRYVPLPDIYLGDPSKTVVNFENEKTLKFCLDKLTDSNVLYGTIVLRFDYDKKNTYTDLKSLQITDSVTLNNNHYCLIRMFDNPNSDFSGPEPNIIDENGVVTATNSHTSPWSKLSWYQDFEEIMMDQIDEDVSVTSVTDGTLLVPLETAGLTSDTRISYWINTNNDRFSLIVMGNPALDYERDRHLISSCYCGRIDSFENSINDVSGNFALYVSSSTTPCKTDMQSYTTHYHINRDFTNSWFETGAVGVANEHFSNYDKDIAKQYPKCIDRNANILEYYNNSSKIGGVQKLTTLQSQGFDLYYVTITGNKFFNEGEQPRYMILNLSDPAHPVPVDLGNGIYYDTVAYRSFIYGASDSRSNQVAIYVNPINISPTVKDNYRICFNFGFYEEKFVITSGITRDSFGNVIDIQTIDDYGKNTSDGVTSVSMYHTRSKAFYQKHHFLFATTEEYMSKVMYGKSSYTGEYYADRIKITHGNDGPRGILCDTLVIDSSSLYPKDELVINKDFSKSKDDLEETFTYFPITAPFSPLADGPNARYGLALKKAEREPIYEDNIKILNIASNELMTRMGNLQIITGDTILPQQTENGCKIYWSIVKEEEHSSNWIEDNTEIAENITINFADGNVKNVIGKYYDANNVDIVVDGFTPSDNNGAPGLLEAKLEKGNQKTQDFKSYVKLSSADEHDPIVIDNSITHVFYGYSNNRLSVKGSETKLTYLVDDGTDLQDNIHEYSYLECFTDVEHEIPLTSIKNAEGKLTSQYPLTLYNAHPSKYLNIFFVKDVAGSSYLKNNGTDTPDTIYDRAIVNYISIPLHYADALDGENYIFGKSYFDLLQYPCNITAYCTGITDSNNQGISYRSIIRTSVDYLYCNYHEQLDIQVRNMNGPAMVLRANYGTPEEVTFNGVRLSITSDLVVDDLYIQINK